MSYLYQLIDTLIAGRHVTAPNWTLYLNFSTCNTFRPNGITFDKVILVSDLTYITAARGQSERASGSKTSRKWQASLELLFFDRFAAR